MEYIKNYAKWHQNLNNLKAYRKLNPNKWPQAKDKNEEIRKIGIWCQSMRQRYRENQLSKFWITRLAKIDFNFDGNASNWLKNYNALKEYLTTHGKLPPVRSTLHHWAFRNVKEQKLLENQQKLLDDIQLSTYFRTPRKWDDYYKEIKAFYVLNGRLPGTAKEYNLIYWLHAQKNKYAKKELSAEKIELLEQLNIIWDYQKDITDKWLIHYEAVKKFKEDNKRFPKFYSEGEERKLYNWCQGQRQRKAGTASAKKKLELWQLDLLHAIDFVFNYKEILEDNWESNYQILVAEFEKNKKIVIKKISKPLSLWINTQKVRYKKGTLLEYRVEKLKKIHLIK